MSEKENTAEPTIRTAQGVLNEFASAVGGDIRTLREALEAQAALHHAEFKAAAAARDVEVKKLHKKLNLILLLGGLGWFVLILSQAVVYGNQDQTYRHITSVQDVTSKVAESAVTDAVTNAAITTSGCLPVLPPVGPIIIQKDKK